MCFMQPEIFSQPPLYQIALCCVADLFADRQPETAPLKRIGQYRNPEMPRLVRHSLCIDCYIFGTLSDSFMSFKGV
jgi:hypothetical protein